MCPGEKFQVRTAMKVLILISFPFLGHTQMALKIIDSPSPVDAILGQNVTIPCVLTDKDQSQRDLDLNQSTDSVRWDMRLLNGREQRVYLLTNGRHTPYRLKSSVEGKGFKRGNASLTLYNVQKSDEGEYICNVFVAGNKLIATRQVEVSARPMVILSSYNVMIALGNEQSVTCYVQKFYPEFVKIRWEKRHGSSERMALDRETCTSVPTPADDGTFNVTSLMTVKPSSLHEDGDKYFCIVSHRSLEREDAQSFTVKVEEPPTSLHLPSIIAIPSVIVVLLLIAALIAYFIKLPPKISDITGMDNLVHGKSSNLSWMVSGFKPRDIEIKVYLERGGKRQDIYSWKNPPPKNEKYDSVDHAERGNGLELLQQEPAIKPLKLKSSIFSYSCLCSISIILDKKNDKGAELVIEVKHAAMKSSLIEQKKLNITGDLFTAHIMSPQYLKHGEEVTLICDITKCDPGPLMITWLKGKKVIYTDEKIQDTRYKHEETRDEPHEGNVLKTSSNLTFMAQVIEDHRVKYTCIVAYSEIGDILSLYYEALITAQPVVEQITSEHVGEQMKLSCRVHSFHPQTIEIKWLKEEEALPTPDLELCSGEDGLYSTTSILYIPETEAIGKTFRCQVDHQSLLNPEIREWKLEEQKRSHQFRQKEASSSNRVIFKTTDKYRTTHPNNAVGGGTGKDKLAGIRDTRPEARNAGKNIKN